MEQTFLLQVTTPVGVFFDDHVESVVVNGVSGEIGILANIMPIVTTIKDGKLQIKQKGKWMIAISGNGFVQTRNNKVSILCQSCIWEHEQDDSMDQQEDEDTTITRKKKSIKEHDNARIQLMKNLSGKNDKTN